ncbi:MAG TPA: hypothetical protein VEF90_05950 [Xanthobacteraceae bacterium]|nr:hypothetical protein [Xanthobacteraceae bacterium]
MTSPPGGFKRVVVGLLQSMANQAAVNAAADFAEFLNVELLATFIADASLHALAGLPAARELRILERGWQAIDPAQISRDIDRAEGFARRCFAEAVAARTIKTSFDIVAGVQAMASRIRADDIVAVVEPAHPGERITRQFTGLLDAALESAAAVVILPRRIARTAGPVIAIAAGPDDGSIRVGLGLAAALRENLIVVTRLGVLLPSDIVAEANALGVRLDKVVADQPFADGSAGRTFASTGKARLRVIARDRIPGDAAQVFTTLHGIPLLVIEPARIATERQRRNAH